MRIIMHKAFIVSAALVAALATDAAARDVGRGGSAIPTIQNGGVSRILTFSARYPSGIPGGPRPNIIYAHPGRGTKTYPPGYLWGFVRQRIEEFKRRPPPLHKLTRT